MRAYEDMGVLMTTWFSNPKFLDKTGQPVALTEVVSLFRTGV